MKNLSPIAKTHSLNLLHQSHPKSLDSHPRFSLSSTPNSPIPSSILPPKLRDHDPSSPMELRTKKSRKNHEKKREKSDLDDRLSSLPDSILTHIFSFLDFDSVIRTSLLSKRFRLLWTISPSLDFKLCESGQEKKTKESVVFESYVIHVLQLREHSNLMKFHLSLHKHVRPEFVENCLNYAVDHKVQHLKIRGIFNRKPLALPRLLLDSPSLISLSLHNATVNGIELPKSLSLPSLKALSLKSFEFSDKNYSAELFSGCPKLETLVLNKCSIKAMNNKIKVLDVNCLNLKHLEIKRWRSPWRCFDDHVINVNAPKLAFLKFKGSLVRVNFGDVWPCLESACFELFFPVACFMEDVDERKQKVSECLLNMLFNVCSSVRVISLSLRTIEVVCSIRDLRAYAPVIFENLRVIKFTVEDKFREKTMPVEAVNRLMQKIASDELVFEAYKVKKVSTEDSKGKSKSISIPTYFMQFLLESSPAAEILTLEIPNSSSDEE